MTDRKPVEEPTLATQRMAERAMHAPEDTRAVQPITLPAINGSTHNHVQGSISDSWGAALVLVQGDVAKRDHDIVVLDFVQAETLYRVLDQFFNS